MGDVIAFKRPKPQDKHRGNTLCKNGFHKWEVVKDKPFDVKGGKLLTQYRCSRCGAIKSEKR